MRRRLFNFAVVVSLALCLLMVVLWARSYRARYIAGVGWVDANSSTCGIATIDSLRGDIVVSNHRIVFADPKQFASVAARVQQSHFYFEALPVPSQVFQVFWHGLGFGYNRIASGAEIAHAVAVPDWLLVVLLAVFPTWFCISARRKSRLHGLGRCEVCGYDLRASPEYCPECGTPVADKAGARA